MVAAQSVDADGDGGEHRCDVVIVGGGLAGLTLGCALGTAGVPTVCIDRDPPQIQAKDSYDIRTTAISFGSKRVLNGVGIWPLVDAAAQPILDIRVADKGAALFVHYDHRDIGDEPLGWIVENAVLRRAALRRAGTLPALTHLAPVTVAEVVAGANAMTVRLADGRRILSRLVVGADGRNSMVRHHADIPVLHWGYGQSAIVCTVGHDRPHRGLAIEHFLPTGPFAVLPMTGDRSSIVWSEQVDDVPVYLSMDDDAFSAELQRRAGNHLGALRVLGPRGAFPLSIQLATRAIGQRIALVGEAAHAIHPVAGQGLNMGLRDVAALAEILTDQHRLGLDLGDADQLAHFQRWRRFDNLLLSTVCDGLVRLFSNDVAPIRLVRNLGLGMVNRLPPAKRFFMRHAMGLVGDLPRLIRGDAL